MDYYSPETPSDVFRLTACQGKQSFESGALAHRRVREMGAKSKRKKAKKAKTRMVYRCKVCHKWHLGGQL